MKGRPQRTAKEPFETALKFANLLRRTHGNLVALAHMRRERGEGFPEQPRDRMFAQFLWMKGSVDSLCKELPHVLEDSEAFGYRVRLLVEQLTAGVMPELDASGPLASDRAAWLGKVAEETRTLAAHLDHAVAACLGPRREPLSDAARVVYDLFCSLPETEARTEKELVQYLAEQGIVVGDNRVRRGIRAELMPYGLEHKSGVGYFIPLHARLRSPSVSTK